MVHRLGFLHLNRLAAANTVGACAIIWLAISLQNAIAQQPLATTGAIEVRSSETSIPTVSPPPDALYRIGPGDVLDIRVFNYPQLSRDAARVDGRGMIRMPLIDGDIQAGCRTENELGNDLAERYLKYQRRPHVDVFIKEYNSQPVAVIGAVGQPGRFQLQRRVRLLELISFAGGPTDKAGTQIEVAHTGSVFACNKSEIVLTAEPPAEDIETYSLAETVKGLDRANPYMLPGDIVNIAEAEQAFVIGNVVKPLAIPLTEPVTVSQAIAMAGGTLRDSDLSRVRIIRRTPGAQTKSEILVSLDDITKRRAQDVELQAGDIINVTTSSGKRFLRTLLGAIAPGFSNLPYLVLR
jgi:polysaccharide export outer membrane protein